MKNREIRTIIGKVESRAEEDGKITLVGQPIAHKYRWLLRRRDCS